MSLNMTAAYNAIAAKIAGDISQASAEELAYLSTALERIGGRASVIEVQTLAETAKTEINDLKTSVVNDINSMLNTTIQTEIDTRKDNALDEIDTAVTAMQGTVTTLQTDIDTRVQNAEDAIDATISGAVSDINDAITGASGAVTGLNSVTYFLGQQ